MKSLTIFLILLLAIACSIQAQTVSFPSSETDLYKKDRVQLSSSALKKITFSDETAVFAVEENEDVWKQGLVNKQGKVLIAPDYIELRKIENGFVAIKKFDNLYLFYHSLNGIINVPTCDTFFVQQGVVCWRSNFKWGALMCEKKSITFVPAIYKSISVVDNKINAVKFNSWKYLTANNKLDLLADSIYFLNDSILIFSHGTLRGIATYQGNELASAIFSHISLFDSNSILVKSNGKLGLLNYQGKSILSSVYDSIHLSHGYYKTYQVDKGWKLYKKDGLAITKNYYCQIGTPSEELIAVQFERENLCTQWGYINTNEEIVIGPSYASAFPFKSGRAVVNYQGETGVINKEGEWIISPSWYTLYETGLLKVSEDGKMNPLVSMDKYSTFKKLTNKVVLVKDNNFYGLLNKYGKLILPTEYTEIKGPYFDSIFVVVKGKSLGLFTEGGYFLSEPHDRFEKLYEFKEGRAMFVKAGKLGFIDLRGNIRVAPQYKEARNYHEGAAAVFLNGKWAFIDPDENILVQPLYQEVKDFRNGLARCRTGKQWSFVGKDGKAVSKLTYDDIKEEEANKWYLIKNGKIGLADVNGREQLAPRYEYVKDIGSNRVIVKKGGNWGIVDYQENFVVPFQYDGIIYNKQKDLLVVMIKGITEEIVISNGKK